MQAPAPVPGPTLVAAERAGLSDDDERGADAPPQPPATEGEGAAQADAGGDPPPLSADQARRLLARALDVEARDPSAAWPLYRKAFKLDPSLESAATRCPGAQCDVVAPDSSAARLNGSTAAGVAAAG
eukprot:gene20707-43129_t